MKYKLLLLITLFLGNIKAQEIIEIVSDEEMIEEEFVIDFEEEIKHPKKGTEKINETYSFYFNENLAKYNRKYGILKNGEMLFPEIFERNKNSDTIESTQIILSLNKNYGLFDLSKERWSIPLAYKYLKKLNNGLFVAKNYEEKYGIIDSNGKVINDFVWSRFKSLDKTETYFAIMEQFGKNGKLGVYEIAEKKVVIPCQYDKIQEVEPGLFIVEQNEKYNLLDANNIPRLTRWYDLVYLPKSNDNLIVKLKNKAGMVDKYGDIIIPIEYLSFEELPFINNSLFAQNKDSLYGFINYNGEITLPFNYINAKRVGNFIIVEDADKLNGVVSLLEKEPRIIIPCKYNSIREKKNFFIVEKNEKFGVCDLKGTQISEISFDEIVYLKGNMGLHIARKGKKYFFVDRIKGKPNKKYYTFITPLSDYINGSSYYSVALYYKVTNKKGKVGLVDLYGKEVIPPIFSRIVSGRDNFIIVEKDNKVGLYHILRKKLLLPTEYDKIILNQDGFFAISNNSFYKIKVDDKATVVKY